MNDVDLQAYLEAAEKATEGPWEWQPDDESLLILGQKGNLLEFPILSCTRCRACMSRDIEQFPCNWPSKNNADFITLSRTAGPAAAYRALAAEAELRELRRAKERLKDKLAVVESSYYNAELNLSVQGNDLLASQQREAKLREALDNAYGCLKTYITIYDDDCTGYDVALLGDWVINAIEVAEQALALTPALDRIAKLERVAEAVRLILCGDYKYSPSDVCCVECNYIRLCKALAELNTK